MTSHQYTTIERYLELRNRNALTHATRTAIQLGILDRLRQGQQNLEQLAESCGIQREPLRLLLQVLLQTGLIEQYEDDYALAQVGQVIPKELEDFGDRYWNHLSHWLTTGETVPNNPASTLDEGDLEAELAAQAWLATPAALDATRALDIGDSRKGLKVLSLFGGSGVVSLALLHRDASSQATLVDTPVALEPVRHNATEVLESEQIQWIEGDAARVSFDAPAYDLVLIERKIHQLSPERLKQTLETAFAALVPAGEIAIIDVFPGQESGDLARTVLEMEFALRSHGRPMVTPLDLKQALSEVGFSHIQFAHLPSAPHLFGLTLASKPLETA